ncbi:thiamine phosphate synthase [Persephonella sp.]
MELDLSLYVITDEKLCFDSLAQKVEEALQGGATVIQYRAKSKTASQMYQEAVVLKKVCRKYGVPFIINDRVDIAVAVDADGVHVGQDDIPAEAVRRIIGNQKILGLSTKNIQQVKEANLLPVDYIGFGSIFPTGTKEDATLAGLEKLKEAVELSVQPVVAIGGINAENAEEVIKTGCAGIAVVSAVFSGSNVKENTYKLAELVKNRQ